MLVAKQSAELSTHRNAFDRAIENAQNSKSANTRRSYRTALLQFAAFRGLITSDDVDAPGRMQLEDVAIAAAVPATAEQIFSWVGHLDLQGLKPSSIATRLAAVAAAHKERRIPVDLELAQRALAGIRRRRGSAKRMSHALRVDELKQILPAGNDLRALRDRALLLLGWCAALRRSELVGLDVSRDVSADASAWIEIVDEGVKVHLLRSKTDALGDGDNVAVPRTGTQCCPAAAVEAWMAAAEIDIGPLFRPISRAGHVGTQRLTVDGLAYVLKRRVGQLANANSNMPITAHSLRAGFVSECVSHGVDLAAIQQTTRHKDVKVLAGYIREQNKFGTAPHLCLGL